MKLLNGKELRNKMLEKLKDRISAYNEKLGLAVIQVGNDEASNVYVGQKEKLANELGLKFIHIKLSSDVSQEKLENEIIKLNNDNDIDGILVQMPLPKHLDASKAQNLIDPNKDVDGLTYVNAGKLIQKVNGLVPCTPKGIIDMLDAYSIGIEGKRVVVIGRSVLVGKPIANLLTNRNATVTIAHSKTKDLAKLCKKADIIIAAVGIKHFVTADMVKKGVVVIDVGINRENGKLYGDVDFDNVSLKSSYITPVPGGVGPMTVYELCSNVCDAHDLRNRK